VREIKHLSVHQWLRSAIPDSQQPTSAIGFLFLKLPPPPCAVLLVSFDHILIIYFHPDIQRTNCMAPVASVHSLAQEWIQAQKVDSHQEV